MDIYKENDFYVKMNRKEIKKIDTIKLRNYIKSIFKESEKTKQEDLLWDLVEEIEKDRIDLALFVRQTAKVFTEDLEISRV